MKILEPSFKIYPDQEMTKEGVLNRIEKCARICYRSQDKTCPGSAEKLVTKCMKRGHSSPLEMGQIRVKYPTSRYPKWTGVSKNGSFIKLIYRSPRDGGYTIYVGSVRAFQEQSSYIYGAKHTPDGLMHFLHRIFGEILFPLDLLPKGIDKKTIKEDSDKWSIAIDKDCRWDSLRWAWVEFLVDRAFSHELVRHRLVSYLQESQRYCAYRGDLEVIRPYGMEGIAYQKWEDAMYQAETQYHDLLKITSPQNARKVLPNSTATRIVACTNLKQWRHIINQRTSHACDPNMWSLMEKLKVEMKKRFQGWM